MGHTGRPRVPISMTDDAPHRSPASGSPFEPVRRFVGERVRRAVVGDDPDRRHAELFEGDGPRWFADDSPVRVEEFLKRFNPDALRYYRLMGAVGYWNSYFETGGPTRKLLSARDALEQANWGHEHPRVINELGGC